ncbi:MAG: anthranilate synthase component I family protein [Aquisalinus sp.]|nr:anthranilate synthase component I family protein [Aquisalinus sp.]
MMRVPLTGLDYHEAIKMVSGQPYAHILGNGDASGQVWGGKWRMIVANPVALFSFRNMEIVWKGESVGYNGAEAFDLLADILRGRPSLSQSRPFSDDIPPFVSGAFGHISYEMGQFLEPSLSLPDAEAAHMTFGIYDAVAAWPVAGGEGAIFGVAYDAIESLENTFSTPHKKYYSRREERTDSFCVSSSRAKIDYKADIQHCIEAIRAGEIFQANLSRQLTTSVSVDRKLLALVHQEFSSTAPAEFSCVLQYPDETYLSFSPERFFKVEAQGNIRKVIAEPVKGTCRRSSDPEEDIQRAKGLLASEKDRAENIMIADLVRNDLSRVCKDGSIQEEKICELQSNAHVHHLFSRITGHLQQNKAALDVLRVSFPCGSITGAPKMRAMQIIGDIEQRPRGIYCGAIGYIDDRGGADFSVAIRTAEAKFSSNETTLTYGSGGGITMLSDPEKEWHETVAKSASFFDYLGQLGFEN